MAKEFFKMCLCIAAVLVISFFWGDDLNRLWNKYFGNDTAQQITQNTQGYSGEQGNTDCNPAGYKGCAVVKMTVGGGPENQITVVDFRWVSSEEQYASISGYVFLSSTTTTVTIPVAPNTQHAIALGDYHVDKIEVNNLVCSPDVMEAGKWNCN